MTAVPRASRTFGKSSAVIVLREFWLYQPLPAKCTYLRTKLSNTPNPLPKFQFGKVGLRGRKTLTVFARNLSAISTPFTVKVRKFSCTPCPPRLKISNMSYSALQRVVSNPRSLKAYLDDEIHEESKHHQHSKPTSTQSHGPNPGKVGGTGSLRGRRR